MRPVSRTVLSLISLCCLISLPARGDDGATVGKPQVAWLVFANGQKMSGVLQSLNSKQVVFKYRGALYTYEASRLTSVETGTGVYIYNVAKGIFEVSPSPQSKNAGAQGTTNAAAQPANDSGFSAKPSNPQTQYILAEGVGTTPDSALKDAFRNAVRQVVGAVVDSETLVKNDEIISDKVLTYSGGFIKTYDEVSKTPENGLFRITIKATVERRGVIETLQAAKVTLKHIDGKGKFAEVVTKLESEKDAKALIERTLEGFPLNVMQAEPVGEPQILTKSESGVRMSFRVRLGVNPKAYDKFTSRFQDVLNRLAIHKAAFTLLPGEQLPVPDKIRKQRVSRGGGTTRKGRRSVEDDGTTQVAVILNVGSSPRGYMSWIYYVLDGSVWEPLVSCYSKRFPTLTLQLLDREGSPIAGLTDSCKLDPISTSTSSQGVLAERGSSWLVTLPKRQEAYECRFSFIHCTTSDRVTSNIPKNRCVICPFFREDGSANIEVVPAIELHRELFLRLDELKSLDKAKCELAEGSHQGDVKRRR
jgi:hypothetical protein